MTRDGTRVRARPGAATSTYPLTLTVVPSYHHNHATMSKGVSYVKYRKYYYLHLYLNMRGLSELNGNDDIRNESLIKDYFGGNNVPINGFYGDLEQ